jgi:NADH-quinone oxidoreductase subunit K
MVPLQHFLYLSALLFCLGLAAVLGKRHVVANLMGIELMLNAANLNLIAFNGRYPENLDGQALSLFAMAVAAAEVAVALAIVVQAFRHYQTADLDKIDQLKG